MSRFSAVAVAAFVSATLQFASAVAVMAAEGPPPPKPAAPTDASSKSARRPMIIHNPDGTFTIEKLPPNGTANGSNASTGLVIPRQLVVPFVAGQRRKALGSVDAAGPCL